MLSKHPDKCQFPHGHTRKVEFVLESEDLDENEMVCDFKIIKEAVGEYIDTFDHAPIFEFLNGENVLSLLLHLGMVLQPRYYN